MSRFAARLLRRARPLLPGRPRAAFRSSVRTARRVARRLRGLSLRSAAGRNTELKAHYRRLIGAAARVASQ